MVLTINGNDYTVKFGIGFVRELDEKYFVKNAAGTKFGAGLETKIPMLLTGDAVTLSEFIYTGTCAEEKRPSQKEVDDYVDQVEDIEKLFDEVAEELKKHNATKKQMMNFLKALEKQEAILEKQKTPQKPTKK